MNEEFNNNENNYNYNDNNYYDESRYGNQNNAYYMDEMAQPSNKGKIGFAVTSLVLGLIGLLCCCCGLGFIAAPLSLIFGIIALVKRHGGKGMAIAGIVISAVSLLASIYMAVIYGEFIKDYFRFAAEVDTVIEEFIEDGELPDYLEKYNGEEYEAFWESAGYDDFDDFFRDVIEESGINIEE
ncbi:MAG: DUF4190 domain-containing protein [Ruminococcus sp.]|nr:DUF4190 domain-containing protein [Ruminococcus sp.]